MSCSICLEDFEESNKTLTLRCTHQFHKYCIDEWLVKRSSCPYCRAYLKSIIKVVVYKPNAVFGNSGFIHLPSDDSLELTISIPKMIFGKKIKLTRLCLVCYTVIRHNKLGIEYYEVYPNKKKKLILNLSTNEDLEQCSNLFNKMFDLNRKLNNEAKYITIISL